MAYQEFGHGDAKDELSIRWAYKAIFSSPQGKLVLKHMLVELGFFDTDVRDERDMGRQDYSRRLLWILGVTDEVNIQGVIDSFLKLPLTTQGDDDGREETEE